jgi:hypothetical protein
LYGYADGDPINKSDPFGLFAVPAACLVPPVSIACAQLLRWVAGTAAATVVAHLLASARNQRENAQFRDALRAAERRMGCRLNNTGRDELYKRVDELDTRAGRDGGVSFQDIVDEAMDLCSQKKYTSPERRRQ